MKCLDQNGVKHLWNCIFNNAVSKSDVDLSANVGSLNPISNNAVCNHVGSIADSLRNSKADYETGTCTLTLKTVNPNETPKYLEGSYTRIGNLCYVDVPTTSLKFIDTGSSTILDGEGLPFPMKKTECNIGRVGVNNTPSGTNYFTVLFGTGVYWCPGISTKSSMSIDIHVMYLIKE